VTLINLDEGTFLAGIEKVAESDVDEAIASGEAPAPIDPAGESEAGGEATPEQGDEA
jgi:DNA gyrase subunit A